VAAFKQGTKNWIKPPVQEVGRYGLIIKRGLHYLGKLKLVY
jgi:hypothetical protein